MRISWLKIGSRVAVVAIIYLLLSIPDSKFQGKEIHSELDGPPSIYTSLLITKHIADLNTLSANEISKLGDSLNNAISSKLLALRSELFTSNSKVIDSVLSDIGLLTAICGSSSNEVNPVLDNLWQWRQLVKEQSLFWSINKKEVRFRTASILSFINECEEFIAANRAISFKVSTTSIVDFNSSLSPGTSESGDVILSSDDISYPYYGLSKEVVDFTPTLNIAFKENDSTFLIGSTPLGGLQIVQSNGLVNDFSAAWVHLRLQQDLPVLISNPKLPALAASFAYEFATEDKASYDFLLKPLSYGSIYEVELLSFAYKEISSTFIMPFSSINANYEYGLNTLGIRNLGLVSPAEIQYHPSVDYIAILYNGPKIKERNIKLAAEMACFSKLDHGVIKTLKWQLPKYRVLNGLSTILKLINGNTIIPEGMASETALIYEYLESQKKYLLPKLEKEIDIFIKKNNYFPTYSEMLVLAQSVLSNKL